MATEKVPMDPMDITVEDYCRGMDRWLRRFRGMNFARWKILQNTAISILVAWLALEAGADPTVSVIIIAVINGISIADLATILGASIILRGEESPMELERKTNRQTERSEKEAKRR